MCSLKWNTCKMILSRDSKSPNGLDLLTVLALLLLCAANGAAQAPPDDLSTRQQSASASKSRDGARDRCFDATRARSAAARRDRTARSPHSERSERFPRAFASCPSA